VTHPEPSDVGLELAALYALGALDPAEAAACEAHLAEGCRRCEAEVSAFVDVAGWLGHAAPQERPAPDVRPRLFDRLRGDWTVIRSTEGSWEAAGLGMTIRDLFRDPVARSVTVLGRLEPGASYPSDHHTDIEELYVLDGDLAVAGEVLRAGDFCAAPSGIGHAAGASEAGCLVLLRGADRRPLLDELPSRRAGPELLFVRAGERTWRAAGDTGVWWKTLFVHPTCRTATQLVRMSPGARLRGHRHATREEFYMLDGDAHVTGYALEAGDYYSAPAGSEHGVTHTERGCLFVVIASRIEPLE
jgi:anti-sigma factor ChrR (cupin superfamily)